MKTKLISAAFLFACCASTLAEMFPIVDVQYGYLIGAVENGKWIENTAVRFQKSIERRVRSVKSKTPVAVRVNRRYLPVPESV